MQRKRPFKPRITSRFWDHRLYVVDEAHRQTRSAGMQSYRIVLDHPGIKYQEFVARGGIPAHLRYDIEKGSIEARRED